MRRRDKRILPACLGIFVAVGLSTFLLGRFKANTADAADLSKFDPGYIISDYVMGNYNSMTESEIQAFLTKKNPCNNRDYDLYQRLSANNPNVSWHWKDGHFVCLSEELFGDGMIIGEGKTAAKIIYETAQEYKINPQVLIVLIEKESSLITDTIPNNYDYRTMTGFGCPDTAPCDAKYFGFKNQIRKAAWLFREVLDGGWTNYPLGENYVQYNPNAACGGSIVNIRNLATSALYRYTPYQPNAGALAAGTGTAYCGAYGNRNFYIYFENWFGGITEENLYEDVSKPRYMMITKDTTFIKSDGTTVRKVEKGKYYKFTTKILTSDDEWCIRTEEDSNKNVDACVLRKNISDPVYEEVQSVRFMKIAKNTNYIDPSTLEQKGQVEKGKVFMFSTKIFSNNGEWCIRTEEDSENNINRCIPRKLLEEAENYTNSSKPRFMKVTTSANYINPHTMKKQEAVEAGTVLNFTTKILTIDDEWCIRADEDSKNNIDRCIPRELLEEAENYTNSNKPRFMKVIASTNYINPHTMEKQEAVEAGTVLNFTTKILDDEGEWCIRTAEDSENGFNKCISRSQLEDN